MTSKYTDRPSPPVSAQDYPNKIKEGNDGNKYISIADKNNIYKWKKISTKKSAEEYYKQYPGYQKAIYDTNFFLSRMSKLKKYLLKIGIKFYFIKWKLYGNNSFDIEYFQEDYNLDENYILYSERRLYTDCRDKKGIMHLIHNVPLNLRSKVNYILQQIFPNRTNGITSDKDAIQIFFNKQNKLLKEKEKLTFMVDIIFKSKKLDELAEPYMDIIDKFLKKYKIGYSSEFDFMISFGTLNVYFRIFINKINEFKEFLKKLENNKVSSLIPLIKQIKYTYSKD